jgi:hypothetical protein
MIMTGIQFHFIYKPTRNFKADLAIARLRPNALQLSKHEAKL